MLRAEDFRILCLGSLALAACSPALNWREVRPVDSGGLVAWFPCKPQAVERRMSWPGVPAASVHVLSCRADGLIWSLTYARMPDADTMLRTQAGWSEAWRSRPGYVSQAIAPLAGGGLTVPAGGLAWALSANAPDVAPRSGRAWHFSHGLTVFQASVWGDQPRESLTKGEDVTTTFTNGLHFPS